MDLTRIDDHDVAGPAVVSRIATRESLHAMQRHSDGVGVVRVAVIRERVERGFQQLDALTPAGPARTLAASHPTDHNKASGCQIFLAARCGRPAELAQRVKACFKQRVGQPLNSDRAKPEHGWRFDNRAPTFGPLAGAGGGRTWWAHFEFTRINTTPTFLPKKIEDLHEAGASIAG